MVNIKKARKKVDFSYNLKLYWEFMKSYKIYIAILIVAIVLSSITLVVDKYLLKIVVDRGNDFSNGFVTVGAFVNSMLLVLIIYISIIAVRAVSQYAHIHYINKLETSAMMKLKTHFFNHIIRLSHNFFVTHKTGSLIARMVRGNGAIEKITDFFIFQLIPLIIQLILVAGSIFYINIASSVTILSTVAVFIIYSTVVLHFQNRANVAYNNTEDFEKASMGDFFTNIDSIKYFSKEQFVEKRYRTLAEKTREALIRYWNYYKVLDVAQTLILSAGTILVLVFPILQFIRGTVSIGDVVFVYTVFSGLFALLFGFVYHIKGLYTAMADFESLFSYNKIENEIKNKKNAPNLKVKSGEVEFSKVSFTYGKRSILKNLDFSIKRNEKIALVGHSGAGKTTLVKLLYRFYDVNKGSIKIDGMDIRDVTQESLRDELSIVPQECILFDDTIYNNIAFSKPDASRKEVFAAMKFAQLDKFIRKLPRKENTIVGERGIKLSGGEKQRVSIARAILANKKILVLDEATSSLDSKTEHEIQKDLWRLMEGRTTIIIAHRLSTIMRADRIVVLDEGTVVQSGKHSDLIKKRGIYQELWGLQKGGYIN